MTKTISRRLTLAGALATALLLAAGCSMPADEFYVSVAPYVGHTHECHFHSLTTCLGGLQNQDVDVRVTNDATGEVLVHDTLRTQQRFRGAVAAAWD